MCLFFSLRLGHMTKTQRVSMESWDEASGYRGYCLAILGEDALHLSNTNLLVPPFWCQIQMRPYQLHREHSCLSECRV